MERMIVGIAVDGHGAHPGAWCAVTEPDPVGLFDGSVTLAHVLRAERAGVDFVTLDDALSLQPGGASVVRGRVDALLTLAKLGPLTSTIGLVPMVTTTHTEPFHVSKNVATLDWVSQGRAGWRVAISTSDDEAAHFGRRPAEPAPALYAEAADAVEVVRRLWDSWEDDAIIRDQPTGRFLDRDKVHYIDFEGERFAVRGPSIVPRSPQGQPIVVVDAVDEAATTLAVAAADVVLIDAPDAASATERRTLIRDAVEAAGRPSNEVFVLAHVELVLGATNEAARDRLASLDALVPWAPSPGRLRYVGTPQGLADDLATWAGGVDGVHLIPAVLEVDLPLLADVVPALGAEHAPAGSTLRDRLGLARPASRYATSTR